MTFNITPLTSPLNARPRPEGILPTGIILHATAGATARSSIEWLRKTGNSYHYIIPRDAVDSKRSTPAVLAAKSPPLIHQCVAPHLLAYHCASSISPPRDIKATLNACTLGISLANSQTQDEPYPEIQLDALVWLMRTLKERLGIAWVTSHAAVQPWNRIDPARLDCQRLAKDAGLEWWAPTAQALRLAKPKGI